MYSYNMKFKVILCFKYVLIKVLDVTTLTIYILFIYLYHF